MKTKTRYSSHVQLQYLMKKYEISQKQLIKELNQYYGSGHYQLIKTSKNKVVGLKKIDSAPTTSSKLTPVVSGAKPTSATKSVKVTYKRKRVLIKD